MNYYKIESNSTAQMRYLMVKGELRNEAVLVYANDNEIIYEYEEEEPCFLSWYYHKEKKDFKVMSCSKEEFMEQFLKVRNFLTNVVI